jgi:hypothetical protein
MRLPTLTPAEYKKEWSKLIEENLRLRRYISKLEEDVKFENERFTRATSELIELRKVKH